MHSTFSKHMHDFSVSDTGENKQQAAMIGGAAAAGGVGLLALIALVFVFVKYRIARLLMNRNKVGDLYTTQDEQLSRRNAYIQDDDTIEKEGSMRDIRQWSDRYFPQSVAEFRAIRLLSRFGHLGIVTYETAGTAARLEVSKSTREKTANLSILENNGFISRFLA